MDPDSEISDSEDEVIFIGSGSSDGGEDISDHCDIDDDNFESEIDEDDNDSDSGNVDNTDKPIQVNEVSSTTEG